MLQRRTIWFSSLVAAAVYFAVAFYLDRSYIDPIPRGKMVIELKPPYEHYGFARVTRRMNALSSYADDVPNFLEAPSPLRIYEGPNRLGPAHSTFKDIRDKGNGRFLYLLKDGLIFSASDNTDPETNGRRYWVVLP